MPVDRPNKKLPNPGRNHVESGIRRGWGQVDEGVQVGSAILEKTQFGRCHSALDGGMVEFDLDRVHTTGFYPDIPAASGNKY